MQTKENRVAANTLAQPAVDCNRQQTWFSELKHEHNSLSIMMSSSESPEDLRPAEDPLYFRKRKVSKTILDALGVLYQVAPSSSTVIK